jgi:RNA ligase
MSTHLYDLLDQEEIAWLLENGYVREVMHPTEPLGLINYTDRAQVTPEIFEQYPSLNHCRGLIWHTYTGDIVARPFPKFWNVGQQQAAPIKSSDRVLVTDKADGSLGIMYRRPSDGFYAIATRGSFMSEQALHATEVLGDKYPDFEPHAAATYLFEIIYPENRIVLNYGDTDDLALLASIDIDDGFIWGAGNHPSWPGPQQDALFYGTYAEALALPLDRPNAEGYVIRVIGSGAPDRVGNMVKIKQEDYVRLHRLVTGLSERRVWEQIVAGSLLKDILEPLPDEFHGWVRDVYRKLLNRVSEEQLRIVDLYHAIVENIDWTVVDVDDLRATRRLFAREAMRHEDVAWALFLLYGGRGEEVGAKLLLNAKPEAGLTPADGAREAWDALEKEDRSCRAGRATTGSVSV